MSVLAELHFFDSEKDWFTRGVVLYFCSLSEGVLRTQFGMFRILLSNFEEARSLNMTDRWRKGATGEVVHP